MHCSEAARGSGIVQVSSGAFQGALIRVVGPGGAGAQVETAPRPPASVAAHCPPGLIAQVAGSDSEAAISERHLGKLKALCMMSNERTDIPASRGDCRLYECISDLDGSI